MNYLFWDSETANDAQYICSFAYVCTDENNNTLFDPVYSLINPECEFGKIQHAKHGLAKDDVADSPTFNEYCESSNLLDLLKNCIFVAHNAKGADLYHIKKSLERYGLKMPEIKYLDTQDIGAAVFNKNQPSLTYSCEQFLINYENKHNAYDDMTACRELFWKLAENTESLEPIMWVPGEAKPKKPKSKTKKQETKLGTVNQSKKSVEDVLKEFEEKGLLLDLDSFLLEEGMRVAYSGTACGLDRDGVKTYLNSLGLKASKSISGKTEFLVVANNVGQTKLDDAEKNGIPIVSLVDLYNYFESR